MTTLNRWIHLGLSATLLSLPGCSCASPDWPVHRYSSLRTANQPNASPLSDPAKVSSLHQLWSWHPGVVGDPDIFGVNNRGFSASPIVQDGRVYVGHLNGRFYAIDTTGTMLWKFPAAGTPALLSTSQCNPSSPGIASSATTATVKRKWWWFLTRKTKVVIFGAPDPASNSGDGRLWAVNAATGALVWKSPVVASRANNEQIGYDSPVVAGKRVYIGISNHCDNPIIAGKVFAIDVNSGNLSTGFTPFVASANRGGGLWSSPASTPDEDVIVTTGNGCVPTNGNCTTEPNPNHALSMIRLDGGSGQMIWKFQPVPWSLDGDPDWAAIPAVHQASCGAMAVAPMKDGWTHAVGLGPNAPTTSPGPLGFSLRKWTFPAAAIPFTGGVHGDIRYTRGAAVWKDVVLAVTGGRDVAANLTAGYRRLHALNGCASDYERVRWWLQFSGSGSPTMGAPSVTRGIVYIGTAADSLYAIADPDVYPPTGSQCDFPGVSTTDCAPNGFRLTPVPAVLAKVGLSGDIRTTPALARGRVYVTTDAGHLHALAP
jgi:outer membrane protein assembly factor BamB